MVDPVSAEIAQQGLEVYSQELSPMYELLRAKLVGQLANNGTVHENLQIQDLRARQNMRLIEAFAQYLPRGYRREAASIDKILAANAYEAKILESCLLWVGSSRTGQINDTLLSRGPYYIIGETPTDTNCSLLLYDAMDTYLSKTRIHSAIVRREEYETLKNQAETGLFTEYAPEEIRARFDPRSGQLQVTLGTNPRMMHTNIPQRTVLPPLSKRQLKRLPERVATDGMAIKAQGYFDNGRISDDIMAKYDVFTHLNKLATAFGKVEAFKELLEGFKAAKPKDPVQAQLEN